jgi:actin-related protein
MISNTLLAYAFIHTLPDGRVITIGRERFRCPEALFKPSLMGKDLRGIHKLLLKCIMKCPMDRRKHIFNNIVLAGGSTCFPGFEKRLHKELQAILPPTMRRSGIHFITYELLIIVDIKVVASQNRKYLSWLGCSLFGNLDSFLENCVWKYEYDEDNANLDRFL